MDLYVSLNEMLKYVIENYSEDNQALYLHKLTSADTTSLKKKDMRDSSKYYDIENLNILFRDAIDRYGFSDSNVKLLSSFHRDIVDQKVSYICGKPISITSDLDDENIINDIYSVVGEDFDKKMNYWVTNASVYGDGWMYVYINQDNQFKYEVVNSDEILAVYSDEYENNLEYVIRYYITAKINQANQESVSIKVIELYDKNYKYTYQLEGEGKLLLKSVTPHFKKLEVNKALNESKETDYSFGKVPFIRLKNNRKSTTDLKAYKREIDDYDINMSDASNNIQEIQNVVWVLKNYDGTDLKSFMHDLKLFKSVKVSENGSVDTKTFEIPFQAREVHLNRLREMIYDAGCGIDLSSNKFGDNPTNQTLKTMYSKLDQKSQILIREMMDSLKEYMYFVCFYLNFNNKTNYDYTTITYTFNLSTVTNESELIANLISSKQAGIISTETAVSKNPYVDDVNIEMESIRNDESAYLNGLNDVDTTDNDFKEFEASGSAA